jgi:2-methylcitrate dehydratase
MTHMVMGSGSGDPQKWDPAASRETLDHSAPFQFARALVDGFWHHDTSYDPDRISDPAFVALWRRVETVEDDEWNRRFDTARPLDKHHGARAVLTFGDGRRIEEELAVADSHPCGSAPRQTIVPSLPRSQMALYQTQRPQPFWMPPSGFHPLALPKPRGSA